MGADKRHFITGMMNKSSSKRLLQNGSYIDAMNVRITSADESTDGGVENLLGNSKIVTLSYLNNTLSSDARCLKAISDSKNETIFWFVHDPSFAVGATRKIDMIVSFNVKTSALKYHVVSMDDGGGENTVLNFNPLYLINGVNLIDNFLFFTDDYNQPRVIDITKSYARPSLVVLPNYKDGITNNELLVIKKPYYTSPSVDGFISSSDKNFLEDRFICFAVRYKYAGNQYSAISQFSPPVFLNSSFELDVSTMSNSGMKNIYNAAKVTYNSGGPLIEAIDIIFKDMNNNIIKVAETINKENLGLTDDTEYEYIFDGNKISKVLPDYEILRLYDNVPRLAKAQTIIGNRLMYGNYVEGYDLGEDVRIDFSTNLISTDISVTELSTSTRSSNYTWASIGSINDSKLRITFGSNIELKKGALLSMSFNLIHGGWVQGSLTNPTFVVPINFSFVLDKDYSSVYQMSISSEFKKAIGIASNIQLFDNAANGDTLTDVINASLPSSIFNVSNSLNYYKYQSGIDAAADPVRISSSVGDDYIDLQIPAIQWVRDKSNPGLSYAIQGLSMSDAEASLFYSGASRSLHSNRDYSVGIIYMDDFNRSSTPQSSAFNSLYVPPSVSKKKNSIQVVIPSEQKAPSWATRFKFAIKPSKEIYNTIYTNRAYKDPFDGSIWLLLQGENAQKVETGDKLIVKKDAISIIDKLIVAEVLDKEAKESDFLPIRTSAGTQVPIPAGVYMQLRPNNFYVNTINASDVLAPGTISSVTKSKTISNYPMVFYPVDVKNPDGTYSLFKIITGATIKMSFSFFRGSSNNCSKRQYDLELEFISDGDYNSLQHWWETNNIQDYLNNGTQDVEGGQGPINNLYNPDQSMLGGDPVTNLYYFTSYSSNVYDPSDIRDYLVVVGTNNCTGVFNTEEKASSVSVNIEIINLDQDVNTMVFESIPQDALPGVWYESSESFGISNRLHTGNTQNQTSSLPAIIETDFFDCYTFGNGVEGNRILDSIIGRNLILGNRVFSTSDVDYREVRRVSDMTYSGIYNDESNINKFNEFNLGLLNYKTLENEFGPIMLLDGRATDVLVLQEDKIGYVMYEKNLLTDAVGGSTISSVPEVLGSHVARIENFGISIHPESYAKWGADKFFTDGKRGVLINLNGSAAKNESLSIVSEIGMMDWFRDLFRDHYNTQKIGGIDPFMKEYILSSNNTLLPADINLEPCNNLQNIVVYQGSPVVFYVDFGSLVGTSTIYHTLISLIGTSVVIDVEYGSSPTTTSSGPLTEIESGFFTFLKDEVSERTAKITITVNGDEGSSALLDISAGCVEPINIKIIQVCINNANVGNQTIYNTYKWADGSYLSPSVIRSVSLAYGFPAISQFSELSGPQGGAYMPSNTADITMSSYKIQGSSNFDFDPAVNRLLYLRTSTEYNNALTGSNNVLDLISAASTLTINNPSTGVYEGTFNMPNSSDEFLYLIYDYRSSKELDLCYVGVSEVLTDEEVAQVVCCDCL